MGKPTAYPGRSVFFASNRAASVCKTSNEQTQKVEINQETIPSSSDVMKTFCYEDKLALRCAKFYQGLSVRTLKMKKRSDSA